MEQTSLCSSQVYKFGKLNKLYLILARNSSWLVWLCQWGWWKVHREVPQGLCGLHVVGDDDGYGRPQVLPGAGRLHQRLCGQCQIQGGQSRSVGQTWQWWTVGWTSGRKFVWKKRRFQSALRLRIGLIYAKRRWIFSLWKCDYSYYLYLSFCYVKVWNIFRYGSSLPRTSFLTFNEREFGGIPGDTSNKMVSR